MTAYLLFIVFFFVIATALLYYHVTKPSLRVLMYHKVDEKKKDRLTVTIEQINKQLNWLVEKKLNIISFKEFKELEAQKKKGRYVILTFDDAYENNLSYALPLLNKTNTKATIFIPTAFIGRTNEWDGGNEKLMTATQLRQLPPGIIELGLHTHTHKNFKLCSAEHIQTEMQRSIETLQQNQIPFVPVVAYAYGGFPKDDNQQQAMIDILKQEKIWYGLRIGNNLNALPVKNNFLIKRIDIRGTDSFFMFKLKVLLGKTSL